MSTRFSGRPPVLVVVAATIAVIAVAWLATGSRTERQSANLLDREPPRLHQNDTVQPVSRAVQAPFDFARDAVIALHGYDTRTPHDPWRRALLSSLGTPEGSMAALDVDRLIPGAAQWEQMAAVGQRASATIGSVYVPALWEQTAREYPELPEGAVGVTVTGTQVVSWDGGASRVPVAVTLLLLCPPTTEQCVVNRIPTQVAR